MAEPEVDRFGEAVAGVVRRLARRRGLSLLAAAGFVGILAFASTGLVFDEDLAAFLPRDDPAIRGPARALAAFRGLEILRIDLGPAAPDASPPVEERSSLFAGARACEEMLAASPLIARVWSGAGEEAALALLDLARRSLPSLVEPAEVAEVASRASTDGDVDELLARHFSTLLGPEGSFLKQAIARDPLGLEGLFFEGVRALRSTPGRARLEAGRIVSPDGRHVLLLVEPRASSSRTDEAEAVLALLERAVARASEVAGLRLRAVVVGGHRSALENARVMKRDAWVSGGVSLAAMLLVYAFVFPRRWLIPVTALPLLAGGLFGLAICRLLLGRLSAIAVGFGGILIGLADDFVVHLYYCFETRARDGSPEPAVAAVRRVAVPTAAAMISTAAAFVALAVSGIPGLRDLALLASTSLVGTLFFALVIYPLLLPSTPARRPLPRIFAPLAAFLALVERRRRAARTSVVLATIGLGFAATGLRFEADPRAIDGSTAEAHADAEELDRRWGDERGPTLVVVAAADLDGALVANERIHGLLAGAVRRGEIDAVSSIAPIAPSRATQERRRAGWKAFWTPDRRAAFVARFGRLGPRHRFSARAFEAAFARLETEGEPVDVERLRSGPLAPLLGSRVAFDGDGALVLTLVKPCRGPDGQPEHGWAAELERSTGAVVVSRHGFARALISVLQRKLVACSALALVVVIASVIPALRQPRLIAAAAIPLVVGLIWSLGLFALAGVHMNAVNFLMPALTFGLAIDYAIFLASGYALVATKGMAAATADIEEAQGAIVASAATTLAGMASLLLAHHPALFSTGVVLVLGMGASLLAIFLITPSLLRHADPAATAAPGT